MLRENAGGAAERTADDIAQIDEVEPRFDGAGFKPRHIEQIGDETIKPLGLFLDRADQFVARGLVEIVVLAPEHAGRTQDRGERRPEIVRDAK